MTQEEIVPSVPLVISEYRAYPLDEECNATGVYFSFDTSTFEKVFIKLYKTDMPNRSYYEPNKNVLEELSHPSILNIKRHFIDNEKNIIVYVLQFCYGGDLYYFLHDGGRLNLSSASCIMWNLVDGLNYMSQLQYVHGNIRLENILLKDQNIEKPNAVFTGFSRARAEKIDTNDLKDFDENDVYVAPEVKTTHTLTNESDIYALGVVFYLLMQGIQHDSSEEEDVKKLRELMSGMMREDPKNRFTIRDCMYHSFFDKHMDLIGKPNIERDISYLVVDIDAALRAADSDDYMQSPDEDFCNFGEDYLG